jgi:hypothetical protein
LIKKPRVFTTTHLLTLAPFQLQYGLKTHGFSTKEFAQRKIHKLDTKSKAQPQRRDLGNLHTQKKKKQQRLHLASAAFCTGRICSAFLAFAQFGAIVAVHIRHEIAADLKGLIQFAETQQHNTTHLAATLVEQCDATFLPSVGQRSARRSFGTTLRLHGCWGETLNTKQGELLESEWSRRRAIRG